MQAFIRLARMAQALVIATIVASEAYAQSTTGTISGVASRRPVRGRSWRDGHREQRAHRAVAQRGRGDGASTASRTCRSASTS